MASEVIRQTFPGVPSEPHTLISKELAVDVKANGAQAVWFDTEDCDEIAVSVSLTALTGGTAPTVQFVTRHSPDGAVEFLAANLGSSLNAVGKVSDATKRSFHRWIRISWTTTGTPATATADLYITAKKRR